MQCDKISVTDAYLKYIPAPPTEGTSLADITLSVELISILGLSEVNSIMNLQFRLALKWKDSRLIFRNLKDEIHLNTIGISDATKIWYPRVVFYNTEFMRETKVCVNSQLKQHFHLLSHQPTAAPPALTGTKQHTEQSET